MSVQSESGRIDYAKSDTGPKGTQMAGDVVNLPGMDLDSAMKGAAGHAANERAIREQSTKDVDRTNLIIPRPEQTRSK